MERAPEKERSRAKRRAKERALERAKAKTRKVSQVENRTKIGKVFVGTVPVTPENENTHVVSNIWWVKLECPVCTAVTDGIALRKHVMHRVYRGPLSGWLERTTQNIVSDAENYQI